MHKNLSLLALGASLLHAHADTSLYEKIAPLKATLYQLSPQELCALLDCPHNPVPVISADQLRMKMADQNKPLVVNVLPEKYYKDCHITGSINAPLPELVAKADAWDRNQQIVVYCALDECDAGEKGCILLVQMGFTHVVDYKGGIKEWFQLSYPTEGPALSEYLHTKGCVFSDDDAYRLYPQTIVCSMQTRLPHKK